MSERLIAKQFADHFSNVCANNSSLRAAELKAAYNINGHTILAMLMIVVIVSMRSYWKMPL